MAHFQFETTPRIVCEQGAADRLGEYAKELGIQHLLVVTDSGLLRTGLIDGPLASVRRAGLALTVYGEVQADPPQATILSAVDSARRAGADGVVGLGGGSSLDTAKLVALLMRSPQPLDGIFGVGQARGPRLPLIQMPTTAGTGSEVTPISIVTTPQGEKKGVVSSLLYPDLAVLDSRLTLGLPPAVTAMTGIDAMVHAIEAYTTRIKKNPLSDALALKALSLLYSNIRTVLLDGQDADARESMLLGSLFAGMAFANAPVAGVHALAYPLGGHFHVPHGLSNSLVLLPVLSFNLPAAVDRYADLGRAMAPALAALNDSAAAEGFLQALRTLVAEMPYAQRLRELGIAESDLPRLADDAMKVQRLLVNNPRPVTHADALAMYLAAL